VIAIGAVPGRHAATARLATGGTVVRDGMDDEKARVRGLDHARQRRAAQGPRPVNAGEDRVVIMAAVHAIVSMRTVNGANLPRRCPKLPCRSSPKIRESIRSPAKSR